MITSDEITEIGRFGQTHGINGEINARIDIEPSVLGRLRCIVVDVDGIYVPFFIKSVRRRGEESAIVMLDDFTNERQVSVMVGKSIYALAGDPALPGDFQAENDDETEVEEDEGFYAEDLIGFRLIDEDAGLKGEIVDIDDSTANILFIVSESGTGRRILIPVAEEYITDIDTESREIRMNLPEGLIEL